MMRRHLPVALYLIVEVLVGTKGFVQAVRMQAVVNRGMAQSSHATCHANLPLPDANRLSHGARDAHRGHILQWPIGMGGMPRRMTWQANG